jgi:hypothetical protein
MDPVGIDVHKGASQICMIAEGGDRAGPHRGVALGRSVGRSGAGADLIEASTEIEWVARCVERLGHEVIVADPNLRPDVRGAATD